MVNSLACENYAWLLRSAAIVLLASSAVVGRITLSRFGFDGLASEVELASVALLIAALLTVILVKIGVCKRRPNSQLFVFVAGILLLAGVSAAIDYLSGRPIAWARVWDLTRISLFVVCLGFLVESKRHLLVLTVTVVGWALFLSAVSYVLWIYDRTIVVSGISWTRILVFALAMGVAHLYTRPKLVWLVVCSFLTFFLFSTSMKVALLGVMMIFLCATITSFTNSWFKPLAFLLMAFSSAYLVSLYSGDFSNIASRVEFSAGAAANPNVIAAEDLLSANMSSEELQRICNRQQGDEQYCLFPYVIDTTERLRLWGRGIQLLLLYPLTGVGINGYEQVLIYYYSTGPYPFTYKHPHNLILDVGTLHGIIALGIFLCLLLAMFVLLLKGMQISRYSVGYFSGACAIFLMSMFGGDVYDARYLFYFSALAVVSRQLNEKIKNSI